MRLYIRTKNGDTYMPFVENEGVAQDLLYTISNSDGLIYWDNPALVIDATCVLIACPYDVIDRKQKEANDG